MFGVGKVISLLESNAWKNFQSENHRMRKVYTMPYEQSVICSRNLGILTGKLHGFNLAFRF